MRIPAEIRLLIYGYLLDDGGNKWIKVRNVSRYKQYKRPQKNARKRTAYHVMERTFQNTWFETTYGPEGDAEMHTAVMSVNRRVYEETSQILYGEHWFDFGADMEAIAPFIQDKLPATRALIREVSVQKRRTPAYESGAYEWAKACRSLQGLERLRKLRLVVEGGRPTVEWEGPRELLVSDLRLLWLVKHDSMGWISELAALRDSLDEVEVVPGIGYMAPPESSTTLLHAAFSASIATSLVDFLRSDLCVPAVAGPPVPRDGGPGFGEQPCVPGTP